MDPPAVRYVKTSDGFSIAYSVTGEGRPFIWLMDCLHGCAELAWKTSVFRTFCEPLGRNFQLVQVDPRGVGNSHRGLRESHGCEDYVLDLEAVLDQLDLNSVILYGTLTTCHAIVRYAARHPGKVAGLILSVPLPPSDAWAGFQIWEGMYSGPWDRFVQSWSRTFLPMLDDPPAYMKRVINQADFIAVAKALTTSRIDDLLPLIDSPALILIARDPEWSPLLQAARAYAASMPNARLVLFEGEGNQSIVFSRDRGTAPGLPVIEEFVRDLPSLRKQPLSAPAGLSIRELEVLRLIAKGRTNPQIAVELIISVNTVQRHVSNILAKTGLANRAEAASYATRNGLV